MFDDTLRDSLSSLSQIDDLENRLNFIQKQQNIQLVHQVDEEDQKEKSEHAKSQLTLWDSFVDVRFKQQKLLDEANRLPAPHILKEFVKEDPSLNEAAADLSSTLRAFLSEMLTLQTDLLERSVPLLAGEEEGKDQEGALASEAKSLLHKRKRDVVEEDLYQQIQIVDDTLKLFTLPVIDKWNHRTSLANNIKATRFKAFDNSLSQQINRALQDKHKLIERSRINRSAKQVIGQSLGTFEVTESDLKRQDPEVFDDTDFFQNILKDLISSTHSKELFGGPQKKQPRTGSTQKVRSRNSKERSLRLDVHPKLVNFVTSAPSNVEGDAVAKLLFKNLFQSA